MNSSLSRHETMPALLIPRMKKPWTAAHFHGLSTAAWWL